MADVSLQYIIDILTKEGDTTAVTKIKKLTGYFKDLQAVSIDSMKSVGDYMVAANKRADEYTKKIATKALKFCNYQL